jgi:hypothetical protein
MNEVLCSGHQSGPSEHGAFFAHGACCEFTQCEGVYGTGNMQ